ncbi:MAG: thioredoxin [Tannerellaceae bacterium]|jgi:thioredoxin|nr:thioredoxin [Tannerellaceae bacterium]
MKKIGCILVMGMIFASCNAQTKTDKQGSKTVTAEKVMQTIHLTKADFLAKVANYETNPEEWEYLGDKPALIDFYADWCGPCKAIAPVLEELAAEYGGQIYIYKIDTEAEQELAAVFGIRSIPSLLFVPMDENPQMTQGAIPKPQLKEAIEQLLLKK